MKPIFFKKNTQAAEHSFYTRYADVPHNYNKFHFHKEYELLYNIANSDTHFVGDSIHRFENHDLVLIGSNIPHFWQSDDSFFEGNPKIKARVVLVQFVEDFLRQFLNTPEMALIKNLLHRATQGIQVRGKEARFIGGKFYELTKYSGWQRLVKLIEALCMMSDTKDYVLLTSQGFCESHKTGNEERISLIFNNIIKNHNLDYKLEMAAELANVNKTAFCRYIKKATSKTFSEVLNEVRIGFACKELINSIYAISNIAYNSGNQNLPYLNRQFRKIKNCSPQEYKI